MKLCFAIEKIRHASKKSVIVRKIIDFVPILSKLDQIAAIYARVKKEESEIIGYLSECPSPVINLVCDFRCTPPTYGDFSAFMLTFKILNSKSKTNFFLLTDSFSSDWKALDRVTAMRSVEDFKTMAICITDAPIKVIEEKNAFEQLSAVLRDGHTIFAHFISRRKKIYWDLKFLNVALYKSLRCDAGVLFNKTNQFSITRDLPKSYVAWHIHGRQNLGASSTLSFEENYDLLRKIVGLDLPVIMMSSPKKLSELNAIAIEKKLDVKSSREFSSNVLGDIDIVNGADLFFQIGGGGLAEFALYSEKPFYLVDYPDKRIKRWNSNYLGLKPFHRKFLPWQNHKQIFMSSKTKISANPNRETMPVDKNLRRKTKTRTKY